MQERIEQLNNVLNGVLLGKETQTKLALACLFGRGHLLIEDLPGMGKTLLSHALARVLGLSYNRIQFTSDVLPSDIIGATIFDKQDNRFRFVEGPLFAQLILADEISPDSCRLWDLETNEKLDKDRFRRDLGGVTEAYAEVARRLGIIKENAQGAEIVDFSGANK